MVEVPGLQQVLLDWATREALSHGAMLFAVLSANFSFLRIVENHANNDKKTKSPWFIPASFLVLYFLLAFSFYVVFRIIYYGVLFSQTIHYPPLATHLNLSSYHYYVTHFEGPVKFRSGLMIQFLYDLFGINRSLLRIIWSFF